MVGIGLGNGVGWTWLDDGVAYGGGGRTGEDKGVAEDATAVRGSVDEAQPRVPVAPDRLPIETPAEIGNTSVCLGGTAWAIKPEADTFSVRNPADGISTATGSVGAQTPNPGPWFAFKANAVLDSTLGILGKWLSDNAKRAIMLLKELLDLLTS